MPEETSGYQMSSNSEAHPILKEMEGDEGIVMGTP